MKFRALSRFSKPLLYISISLPLHAIELTWDNPGRQFVSSGVDIETINQQSDGSLLDSDFFFVLGSFLPEAGGGTFEPTSANLDDWATYFVPFGGARYERVDALIGTGLPPAFVSGFARNRNLDNNQAPFRQSDPVYIWGFNVDSVTGATSEWCLYTQEEWSWPPFNASSGGDVGVYSITDERSVYAAGEEIEAVYGGLRLWVDSAAPLGFHDNPTTPLMTTAAVTGNPSIPRLSYEQWVAAVFPSVTGGQTQADAGPNDDRDEDGLLNFEEFIYGQDPLVTTLGFTPPTFQTAYVDVAGETFFEGSIQRSPFAAVNWVIQESTTLQTGDWDDLSMTGTVISNEGNLLKVRSGISVETDTETSRFFRLMMPQPPSN